MKKIYLYIWFVCLMIIILGMIGVILPSLISAKDDFLVMWGFISIFTIPVLIYFWIKIGIKLYKSFNLEERINEK